jgi:hypothetical protein
MKSMAVQSVRLTTDEQKMIERIRAAYRCSKSDVFRLALAELARGLPASQERAPKHAAEQRQAA